MCLFYPLFNLSSPEFISGSCDDNGTLFLPLLPENLKQVQIDGGCKGLLSFCPKSRDKRAECLCLFYPFLIYRLPEFISGSCDDNGTLFLPLLPENLKQVQIDGITDTVSCHDNGKVFVPVLPKIQN